MRPASRSFRPIAVSLLLIAGLLLALAGPVPAQEEPAEGEPTTTSHLRDFPDLPEVDLTDLVAEPPQGTPGIDPEVTAAADAVPAGEPVSVLVELDVPVQVEATLTDAAATAQRAELAAAASEATSAVQAAGGDVSRTYEVVPWVAAQLTADQLDDVLADPAVRRIALDAQYDTGQSDEAAADETEQPDLFTSQTLIGATEAWAQGFRGQGRNVAIIDTGVESTHPFFTNRVVNGACFSSDAAGPSPVDGSCPGTSGNTSFGVAAGAACTFNNSRCDHGTHVAGIAAGGGNGFTFSGVANGSGVIAVQAAGRVIANNNETFLTSDLMAALEWLFNNRSGLSLRSINMSLGGGGPFNSNCTGQPLEGIIQSLRAAGIPSVIATGNNGFNNGVAWPSCVVGATAVGNSNKANDTVWSSSNSGNPVDLLAPGSGPDANCPGGGIASSVLFGGYDCKTGTSMAAPHVAGAMALLDQKAPGASVSTLEASLVRAGVGITDPDNNVRRSRIEINDALRILFRDVDFNDPFWTDITWLAFFEITTGFNNGTLFRPTASVTRQAMAAFLYRLAGSPAFAPPPNATFSDVPTDHPFFREIEWLSSEGIAGGFGDGTFRGGASVTRQAMAAFMFRFAGEPAFTVGAPDFSDVPPSHPFFQAIEWMAFANISTGFNDGTFRPSPAVTRQAMAAFMFRLAT